MLGIAQPRHTAANVAVPQATFMLRRGHRADTIVCCREERDVPVAMFPRHGFWIHATGGPRLVDPTVMCLLNDQHEEWVVSRCSPALFLAERRLIECAVQGCDDPETAGELMSEIFSTTGGEARHGRDRLETHTTASVRRRALVDEAKARVASAYHRRHSLDDLAVRSGCSSFHLCRTFRAVEGTTLTAYRSQLRLRAAVDRLLSAPAGGLIQVALDLGFSSHSHFTEAFRRTFGLTPSKLLRDMRRAGL
jgi:AraC-like DNA-binding protein